MSFWTGSIREGLGPRLCNERLAEACGDPQYMTRKRHGPGDAAGFSFFSPKIAAVCPTGRRAGILLRKFTRCA